jgi:two-component system, NarL family, sensor kinase
MREGALRRTGTLRRVRFRPRHDPKRARRARPEESARWLVARQVAQFTLVGVAGLLLVGFGTAIASRRVGEREAIVDARTTALAKAQGVVEPVVTDGLLTAQPAAVRAVADVVQRDVLDRNLVRVKIWTSSGTIVYSDEPRLAGARYPLEADERAAIANGTIQADVSNLQKPENRFERQWDKLLEVYLPVRTPGGRRLLF